MTDELNPPPRATWTRRSMLGLALGGALLTGCQADAGGAATSGASARARAEGGSPRPTPTSTSTSELPLGGRVLFPRYRLAGWCGAPSALTLGELGRGNLDDRVRQMLRAVAAYGDGRTVLPVMELVTVVVQSSPGRSGLWRFRQPDAVVESWLRVAREHGALLLLNIQPGRAAFLDEVKAFADYVGEPDVGIALDPEWAMAPGQVPGRAYGHTDGETIDAVAGYLTSIVAAKRLPEKVLVYHQVARSVVRRPTGITRHEGVQIIRSIDGIGSRDDKTSTWSWISQQRNPAVRPGFKLFFTEDRRHGALMTPTQVLALTPRPDYVMYE